MATKKPRRSTAKPSARKKAKPASVPAMDTKTALGLAANPKKSIAQRVAAAVQLTRTACDDSQLFDEILAVLKDGSVPSPVRLAVLQALQAATFSSAVFDICRPGYLSALRSLVKDPDKELRQRVLGILSREHDGYTQQLLLEGLRDPKKALVPADKALQLLSYDVHSDAYPVAREIVRNPPNQRAKREAMRLLAADANSVGMFETILGDKKEAPEIRQLSATALYSLAPKKLESMARKIVLDKKDDHKVKATSLTALASFGGKSIAKDKPLIAQVKKLEGKAGSTAVKRGANQFLRKYVP